MTAFKSVRVWLLCFLFSGTTLSAQSSGQVGSSNQLSQITIRPVAPAATTRSPISNAPYVAIAPSARVSAVAFRLLEALMRADYRDQAWFVIAGPDGRARGAAVFTGPEVINEKGKRVTDQPASSVLGAIHTLIFGPPVQRIRYFAFYLSDLPLTRIPQPEVTPDSLNALFARGARTPAFPALGTINAAQYELVAYVYVIERSPLTGELTLVREAMQPGNQLNAKAHLKAAGIWRELGYLN